MKLALLSKKEISKDVWEVSFDTKNKPLSFIAGQYIRLVLPRLDYEDSLGQARLFSIVTSPNDKEKISIIFRASDSGFKKTFLNFAVGTELEVEGPWGTFVLPKGAERPMVFVAGGTGIAPFLSMIRFATEENLPHKITLVFAFRNKGDAIYLPEFKKITSQNRNIKMFLIFGSIKERLLQKSVRKGANAIFYISGPKTMVHFAWSVFQKNNVAEADIRYEEWIGFDYFHSSIMRNLFEMTTDAVAFTDIAGVIRYVNSAWEKLSGWSSKEVVDRVTPRVLKSGKQNLSYYKSLWDHLLAGKTVRGELIDKRKDGRLYEVDHLRLPLFSSSKQIVGFADFQREISEGKRKQHEQTKAILAGMGEGLVIVDHQGKILMTNKAFEQLTGYSDIVGKRYFEVWQMEGTDKKVLSLEKRPIYIALQKHKHQLADKYSYIRSDGTSIPVSITVSPYLLEKRNVGAIVIVRDITYEREVDKAKTEFVSFASHQLRTPLSTINWYTEMLLAGDAGTLKPEQIKYLNEIYTGNQRMVELVNALLNVSRLELGTFIVESKPTEIVKLIQSALEEQKPLINEKKIKVSFLFEKSIPQLLTDPKLLRMVVQNILSNALKYTPKGGRVDLSLSLDKEKKNVLMKVVDTGYGIPKNQQDKVYNKFFRADNVRERDTDGTGLGLYIVKLIIKLAGGKVWFESPASSKVSVDRGENPGTIFYVKFPLRGVKKKAGTKELV